MLRSSEDRRISALELEPVIKSTTSKNRIKQRRVRKLIKLTKRKRKNRSPKKVSKRLRAGSILRKNKQQFGTILKKYLSKWGEN